MTDDFPGATESPFRRAQAEICELGSRKRRRHRCRRRHHHHHRRHHRFRRRNDLFFFSTPANFLPGLSDVHENERGREGVNNGGDAIR